ncbi:MAG: hypothetical protein AUK47_16110 [Deltaproteobacteria bacterium CG2_30_63_29]|nr:MAG: hypothetical protein AUK47_16110 [Deltaproteobacteria bacterium CG2_30_63_29]
MMMPNPLKSLLVVSVMLVMAVPAEAFAYVRSITCGDPPNPFQCEAGETSKEIGWPSSCVVVHLNENGTGDVDFTELERVSPVALEVWSAPECSYFNLVYGGLTNEDRVGYNPNQTNANVLVFRDTNWSHRGGVLALTSVTFDRNSGTIVDADIEFNSQDFQFTSVSSAATTQIDLENTMVHELGHLVGLDHTPVEEATMFASAPEGEIKKRSLAQDDLDGYCAIYPIADLAQARSCKTTTVGYYQKPEGTSSGAGDDTGCQVLPLRNAPGTSLWWFGALLATGALLRRPRRSR